jgi:excinuclease ABC subunit C
LQSEEKYNQSVEQIKNIIKGDIQPVLKVLENQMLYYAEKLQFEKAQEIKEQIEIIEKYKAKATVVSPKLKNLDVFHILNKEKTAYVSYLKINQGAIVQGQTVEIRKKLNEPPEQILSFAILEMRERFKSSAKEIVVPFIPEELKNIFNFTVPKRDDKKKLLDLALKNAATYAAERQRLQEKQNPQLKTERILKQLQKDLRLKELPVHIECFDNSNFQGTDAVAACVVFKNAKPSKKDYRHFNIKTVEGPNDFASMEEVVYRRYKRLLDENQSLPQLIVIDGGKGQLSSALKSLKKLNLHNQIAIIGIAKKLEEIYFPNDPFPLHIDKKSESLKVIQYIRNEAHRFGVTHHRKKRAKTSVQSSLDKIPGVGIKTKQLLLKEFKSVKKIKSASVEDFQKILGEKRGKTIFESVQKHLS